MSWMTGLGWKDGLTGIQIQKVTNVCFSTEKNNGPIPAILSIFLEIFMACLMCL